MDKSEAMAMGKARGRDAAVYCDYDAETDESIKSAAYESEMNARDFSPFEHYAHDFNESDDPDSMWEAYDTGVDLGIAEGIVERMGGVSAEE